MSTCHTFKRPLMSPVATRVESWLKPAQVTESLWPARKSGQKEKKVSGYLVLETHDPVIWPLERTRGEKDRQTNPRIGTPMRCCFRNQHPQVSPGIQCWRSTQPFPCSPGLRLPHHVHSTPLPEIPTSSCLPKYCCARTASSQAFPGLPWQVSASLCPGQTMLLSGLQASIGSTQNGGQ